MTTLDLIRSVPLRPIAPNGDQHVRNRTTSKRLARNHRAKAYLDNREAMRSWLPSA